MTLGDEPLPQCPAWTLTTLTAWISTTSDRYLLRRDAYHRPIADRAGFKLGGHWHRGAASTLEWVAWTECPKQPNKNEENKTGGQHTGWVLPVVKQSCTADFLFICVDVAFHPMHVKQWSTLFTTWLSQGLHSIPVLPLYHRQNIFMPIFWVVRCFSLFSSALLRLF